MESSIRTVTQDIGRVAAIGHGVEMLQEATARAATRALQTKALTLFGHRRALELAGMPALGVRVGRGSRSIVLRRVPTSITGQEWIQKRSSLGRIVWHGLRKLA